MDVAYADASRREETMVVTMVTGNNKKLVEIKAIMEANGVKDVLLEARKLDLPELQGDAFEVAREKLLIASREVGGAVMVEDTSLCFNALNGLPGPYCKWFLELPKSKPKSLALYNMLHAYEDKSAYAQCIFAYCEGPGYDVRTFEGRVEGTIVPPPPSDGPSFGWDDIFMPNGYNETFAQMKKETKNSISHRKKALDKLCDFFTREGRHSVPLPASLAPVCTKCSKRALEKFAKFCSECGNKFEQPI